jgi:hypothetical protein
MTLAEKFSMPSLVRWLSTCFAGSRSGLKTGMALASPCIVTDLSCQSNDKKRDLSSDERDVFGQQEFVRNGLVSQIRIQHSYRKIILEMSLK